MNTAAPIVADLLADGLTLDEIADRHRLPVETLVEHLADPASPLARSLERYEAAVARRSRLLLVRARADALAALSASLAAKAARSQDARLTATAILRVPLPARARTLRTLMLLLATCRRLPEPDADEQPLLDALRAAGANAHTIAWDDPADPVPAGALVVLRSTWNYYRDLSAFLAWCDAAARAARLLNPIDAVRWNVHKRYLAELERRGVPIVPTVLLDAGRPADLARILRDRGWDDVVAKPAVSASSFMTRRFRPGELDAARRFLTEQLGARDMMVQPYMASVDDSGERSIIVIEGEVTHSVRKSPRFTGSDESVSEALAPDADELAFARRTIEAAGFDCLYARVDVMRDAAGALALSELELVEPSLFLLQSPPALARFVRALLARL